VIVCIIIAIFPITANTLFGLLSAERGQHDLFTLQGASRWTRLTKLQLPAAMPAIFAGFRISAGLSVIGAVVGDFFFRQGNPGIGILIDVYRARLNNPLMYGAVILAALLGITVFALFGWIGQRVTGNWYENTRKSS
jgi:NitT/TauT family transport system permease protein